VGKALDIGEYEDVNASWSDWQRLRKSRRGMLQRDGAIKQELKEWYSKLRDLMLTYTSTINGMIHGGLGHLRNMCLVHG